MARLTDLPSPQMIFARRRPDLAHPLAVGRDHLKIISRRRSRSSRSLRVAPSSLTIGLSPGYPLPALPLLRSPPSSPPPPTSDHLKIILRRRSRSSRSLRVASPRCPSDYLKIILVPALALLALPSSLPSLTAGLSPDYPQARPPPHAPASHFPHVGR